MEKQSCPDFHDVDESQVSVFSRLLQPKPMKLHSNSESWGRHQIQKVPAQMRRRVLGSEQVYDPTMVSIGPYHHGKPELRRAEDFKHLCLDQLAGGDEKKKAFFYYKILDEIVAIRDCYADVEIVEKYDDNSLALMMLLDASMIIDFMHNSIRMNGSNFCAWQRCLGASSGPLMVRDMVVIENQIPFRVLKMLLILQYGKEEAAVLVSRFLMKKTGIMELKYAINPRENEDPPIHLLEAFWRLMVRKNQGSNRDKRLPMREVMDADSDIDINSAASYTAPRSVMDLKTKGIRVRPNCSRSVRDITFRPNACFSNLYVPVQFVSSLTPVAWSNMIAFEILPNSPSRPIMLSYVLFLKSLIQTPEDVKELQEAGVILNMLGNLEKVVEHYKEIDTFGLYDQDVFKDVKREIEEHCNNRARTWIAELIYTRFRSPWTAIALFAAGVLLCLTFLQTFYTIRR